MRTGLVHLTRLAALATVTIGTLAVLPAANALTQVYSAIPQANLDNCGSECSGTGLHRYNGCSGATGFHWADTLPSGSVVSAVLIEFSEGVDCHTLNTVFSTTLNTFASGTWTSSVNSCLCLPTPVLKSVNVTGPGLTNYKIGLTNAFLTTSPITTCLGYSAGSNGIPAGSVGRVTVTYTAGSSGGTCADQASVNKLETKLDDGTRFTSDSERTTQTTTLTTQMTTNTATINTNINTATAAIIAEVNQNEAKIDKIETKGDAAATETKAIQREQIENALLNIDRTFWFYAPNSCGGRLEQTMAAVNDVIQKSIGCGMGVGNAQSNYQNCVDNYNAGQWKNAFDACRQAYRDVVTGN